MEADTGDLRVVFRMFHRQMLQDLEKNGRRESSYAAEYWRNANLTGSMISPVPFNRLARVALSSQASSASAERLFSDLGRPEGS